MNHRKGVAALGDPRLVRARFVAAVGVRSGERSAELGALVSQTNKLMIPVDFFDFKSPA